MSRTGCGAAVQIHRRQYCLEGVHQQSLLGPAARRFLSTAQMQISPEIEALRRGQQMQRADQMILEQRKLAFVEIPEMPKQPFADQPAQNRSRPETQAARYRAGRFARWRFICARAVCERANQQAQGLLK